MPIPSGMGRNIPKIADSRLPRFDFNRKPETQELAIRDRLG